jgi:hypothetical protein
VYPYVGIRQSSLMSYKLESNIFPINLEYPIKYYSNFNKYSIGLILGTGLRISNLLALEAETNLDFNYLVKRDNLEVKNWIWSIGATLNVAELLTPKKRLTEVKKIKKKLS